MADRSRWPELLREVAEALGDAAALRLVAECGGQRIYVPGDLSAKNDPAGKASRRKFASRMGDDLAAYLIEFHGGDLLTVPNFAQRLAEERRKFVLRNGDLSANTIAARLKITSRRVEQIREDARDKPDQPSLF